MSQDAMSKPTLEVPVAATRGAPAAPASAIPPRSLKSRLWFDELGVVVALFALILFIGTFHPGFLESQSLLEVIRAAALIGPMVFGMVFLLSMGEIDLSVGSLYGLTVVGSAWLISKGLDPWLGAVSAILFGVVLGALNGLLANRLRVSTIIVTLGTLSMFKGITLTISDGSSVTGLPQDAAFFTFFGGELAGLPVSVIVLLVTCAALTFVYRRTRFGMLVRAAGSNRSAAEFSGIPVARVRLQALMLMGALCGICGALTLAFFGSADPTLGTGQELEVIAAAIIGGTPLSGGSGTVVGAGVGILIIETINSGLSFFGVAANWGIFVTGAVIVLAVALDGLVRRRRATAGA
jgi:ribose transport system permease protein